MSKIPTEENKELKKWKSRYDNALSKYQGTLTEIGKWLDMFEGTKEILKGEGFANKKANNVRNIVYELIESQVDPSVPMPKVTAIHKEDEALARNIEHFIINEIKTLHLHKLNDTQERITPVMGGDFMQVSWDSSKGYHTTLGDLAVSSRRPTQIVPQPGISEIEQMDYLFVRTSQTKRYVKDRYKVNVDDAKEESPEVRSAESAETDIVTIITAYYRNDEGGIGLFTWCDDYILEEMQDFQARHLQVCAKCGKVKRGNRCECGSKKFIKERRDYEELVDAITISNEMEIAPYEEGIAYDEEGNPLLDESGNVQIKREQKKIPYYKPNCYPVVCRKNVSREGHLLGYSDVDVIKDQQESIKKYGSRILEESFKGGSLITLPQDLQVETTDEVLKIVRIKNPAEKALIDVINLAPSVSQDLAMLENNYQWAKSTLGISDAFQGKYDSSATSGTAKQYSINQTAGRLESKRVMKNDAWAQLYEIMFKYLLAYADQKVPITYKAEDGQQMYEEFDRYKFLKIDAAGELYWNDEFIFETDPTSTMMSNREAMWNSIDVKYQAGAYGPIGETSTLLLLWKQLEANGYPNAGIIRADIERRYQEEQQMMQGGIKNAMPEM